MGQKNTAIWKSRTKKSVAVGVVAVVLAITVQFCVNYFTNELSKESHVDGQGAMVSTDGKVVKTQMEEMKVDADGKLLSRNGDAAVKTMPSLAKVALASSLPDATLMALDEITVHSDKGYTLQIKVHGFSRVPVLNSRCGNVVHFYTAWKGEVTLDSTDLSFDEATAAEFKNAGFSLANGGRRLAGKITVDGFAKALDGMREGGRWTCAEVPLPTFYELGERKETSYSVCGTKADKNSICYSNYGGLKVGVTSLEGSLAAAVTSQTDRLKGKQTEKLFVKSSSAVMNSDLYRVSFSEYAMHPGQQLVAISDLASGKKVTFQMETDQTRSHCVVASDQVQKANQQAKKSATVDSDWHFEYLGTNEEDGRVLRHFGVMFSSEYTNFVFGENTPLSLPNYIQFWDVAETMQPQRLLLGTDSITEFDSYKKSVSDLDVEAAVKTRTGKSVADHMKCSRAEAAEGRPEMNAFGDLSTEDADYYKASSATKSEALAQYLDATFNSYAMPDMCYEKCKAAVDAVMSEMSEATDICKGSMLENALSCLQETGMGACSGSIFSSEHAGECSGADSNDTVRALGESEDAVEVLVNETPKAMASFRQMTYNVYHYCPSKHIFDVQPYSAPDQRGHCVQQTICLDTDMIDLRDDECKREFIIKITSAIPIINFARGVLGETDEWLRAILNRLVGADWEEKAKDREFFGDDFWDTSLGLKIMYCANYQVIWGLPKFIFVESCGWGEITPKLSTFCPDVTGFSMSGSVGWYFLIGFQKGKWTSWVLKSDSTFRAVSKKEWSKI